VLWLRSAFFAAIGPGTVLAWGPLWILSSTDERFHLGPARWAGVPLLALGVSALLSCVWEFGHRGRGTLAAVDAPRFVVRRGLYRYVRNPMYVSVATALLGEVILFQSPWLIAWTAAFLTASAVFVVAYEEPRLAQQFGDTYDEYRRSVPRWIPKRPA
jgi:protein-S-isoprenylcysteine O-methyltransferase Ste14